MASIINLDALTLDTLMQTDISKALIEKVINSPQLNQLVTIVPGIKGNLQLPIFGRLGKSGKKITACETTPNPNRITADEKIWSPVYIGDRFQECFTNLMDGKLFQWTLKNGVQKPDLTNTDFANFLEDAISQSMIEAIMRLSFFGDTDIAAGDLAGGADDVKYYDPIDGFFKQAFAIGTSTPAQRVILANNAATELGSDSDAIEYADQEFSDTDTTNQVVTKFLRAMVTKAPITLRQQSGLLLPVTQSIYDQYENERENAGCCTETSYKRVEENISGLSIKGIPLIAVPEWDRIINTDFNDGTRWDIPHRALLYSKDNLMVGTEEEANLSQFDAFYDKLSKTYNVDYAFNMDAKIGLDGLIMVGY